MKKTLITSAIVLSSIGLAFSIETDNQKELIIKDDGVSDVKVLPIDMKYSFLGEERYTLNDLISEREILIRRGDDRYLEVEKIIAKLENELYKIDRTLPTVDEVFAKPIESETLTEMLKEDVVAQPE